MVETYNIKIKKSKNQDTSKTHVAKEVDEPRHKYKKRTLRKGIANVEEKTKDSRTLILDAIEEADKPRYGPSRQTSVTGIATIVKEAKEPRHHCNRRNRKG